MKKGETFPNAFYETSITLIPKPEKKATRKKNYRLMSLMNVDRYKNPQQNTVLAN